MIMTTPTLYGTPREFPFTKSCGKLQALAFNVQFFLKGGGEVFCSLGLFFGEKFFEIGSFARIGLFTDVKTFSFL